MKEQIKIQGMSCQHCAASVKRALESLKGLADIRVDLEEGQATFSRPGAIPMAQVKQAVEEAGYRVSG